MLLAVLLAAAGVLPIYTFVPSTAYVSPTGSDVTGTGAPGSPFATLSRACTSLAVKRDGVVYLEPGTYYDTAWSITDACSGDPGHPLTFVAQNGINTVHINGGHLVDTSQCAVFSGSVYKCPITGTPWTIYEGGLRQQLARSPDVVFTSSFPMAWEPGYTVQDGSYTTLIYSSLDFDPTSWHLPHVVIQQWEGPVNGHSIQWYSGLNQPTSVNTSTHTFTFPDHFKYNKTLADGSGNTYVVEGDRSFISVAGEWMVDRDDFYGAPPGGGHYLYIIPANTPISGETIWIPTTQDVVTVAGASSTQQAHDIVFKNLTIEDSDIGVGPGRSDLHYRYATWGTGNAGDFDPSVCAGDFAGVDCGMQFERAQPESQHGLVHLTNAHNISFVRDNLTACGLSCLYTQNYASWNIIQDSWVHETGFDGIQFEGWACGAGDRNNHNTIYDVKIDHFGELLGHGVGMQFSNSGHNTVSHLEIGPGVGNGLIVTDVENVGSFDGYAWGNVFSFIYGHDTDQDRTDGGFFYVFAVGNDPPSLDPTRRNYFFQNRVENINVHPGAQQAVSAAPAAFYTDNQTSETTVEDLKCSNIGKSTIYVNNCLSPSTSAEGNLTTNQTVSDVCWGASGGNGVVPNSQIGLTAAFPY